MALLPRRSQAGAWEKREWLGAMLAIAIKRVSSDWQVLSESDYTFEGVQETLCSDSQLGNVCIFFWRNRPFQKYPYIEMRLFRDPNHRYWLAFLRPNSKDKIDWLFESLRAHLQRSTLILNISYHYSPSILSSSSLTFRFACWLWSAFRYFVLMTLMIFL